jgi:ankyrin repeat protein
MSDSSRPSSAPRLARSTRALPERPSLEHLKKQAKALLGAARSADPSALVALEAVARDQATPAKATLANAQHALANEYGFGSWPRLKTEVQLRRAAAIAAEGLPLDPEQRMDLVYAALDDNDMPALRGLLDRDPALAEGWGERRPLAHAAENNRVQAIDWLLDAGASLEPAHSHHHPPLSWAITTYSLAAARRMIERGAPLDLWCAAGLGWVERMPEFFDARGQPIPNASRHGATRFDAGGKVLPKPPSDPVDLVSDALFIASRNGQLDAARFLLDRGADPAFEGFIRAPALHWAAFSGNHSLVLLLLERGANPEQRDGTYQASYRQFGVRNPIEWGWLAALQRALAGDPSLVNERDSNWGPALHAAAAKGLDGHVHALLAAGADPRALDHAGRSALECARSAEHAGAAARVVAMLQSALTG